MGKNKGSTSSRSFKQLKNPPRKTRIGHTQVAEDSNVGSRTDKNVGADLLRSSPTLQQKRRVASVVETLHGGDIQ